MASYEQMQAVACNCNEFESECKDMQSCIGTESNRSCINCKNLVDDKCIKGVYDQILTSIDVE